VSPNNWDVANVTESVDAYISDADKEEYRKFVTHHLPSFARTSSGEVWHYTSGQALVPILTSGKLYATQVSCLNDTLEQRYFGDLVHAEVKQAALTNNDTRLTPLFRVVEATLSDRDFSATWHFVTCFSEVEDDLGQWRGYGGGQCGYAIGFNLEAIMQALPVRRLGAILLPMNYDIARQQVLVKDVIENAKRFFLDGLNRYPNAEKWAAEFVAAFAWELDIFACLFKHPKFAGEHERRIVTALADTDLPSLTFIQKNTLLARHLPLDLRMTNGKLPITRVVIGPGPAQRVTQVSVGTLLKQQGYDVPIEMSSVPYRVP
jgi:hypothetical protein